jgi:hypothetical protein
MSQYVDSSDIAQIHHVFSLLVYILLPSKDDFERITTSTRFSLFQRIGVSSSPSPSPSPALKIGVYMSAVKQAFTIVVS